MRDTLEAPRNPGLPPLPAPSGAPDRSHGVRATGLGWVLGALGLIASAAFGAAKPTSNDLGRAAGPTFLDALMLTTSLGLRIENEPKSDELRVGDPAPPLKPEQWIKGHPVPSFEAGKVYIIEFWATHCDRCVAEMPHLTHAARKLGDRGLVVVGVNIWEDQPYTSATVEKVRRFVDRMGQRMDYVVAFDGSTGAIESAYHKAARRGSIPVSFIVGPTGNIAWIGHPVWAETVATALLDGSWNQGATPAMIDDAHKRLKRAATMQRSNPAEALAELRTVESQFPTTASRFACLKVNLLYNAGDETAANALAPSCVERAMNMGDADGLNMIAWGIVDPKNTPARRDLDLALRAATVANTLHEASDPAVLDTLARVHFLRGDTPTAISLQRRAIELASEAQKAELRPALVEYEAAGDTKP